MPEYKDVPGMFGYRVGDDGSVWTCLTQKGLDRKGPGGNSRKWIVGDEWVRKATKQLPKGYLLVNLSRRMLTVHQLVLGAFVGPRPPGCEARHLNGDPTDNRLCNLQWGTRAENYADRLAHGTHAKGTRNPCAKLTDDDVRDIRAALLIKTKQRDLAKKYGVSQSAISVIGSRQSWGHV